MKLTGKLVIAGALALAFGGVAVASALGDQREATMKDIARALKPLAQMDKSGSFDAAAVKPLAEKIAADLDKFKELFPAGSENADKAASPEIWTDAAGFEAARTKAHDAAMKLGSATDAASFKTALADMTASCKGCHTKYRLD